MFVSLLSLLALSVNAFVPSTRTAVSFRSITNSPEFHPAVERRRNSVAKVQTQGLFGLGAPEIGIILIAAAFLLGPQKLAELGKDAGKIAGELKRRREP